MEAKLDPVVGPLNLRFAEILKKLASDKKKDTHKKLPISQLPEKFKCWSFMGQNVLLFRYIIAYDCKNVLP